MSKEAEWAVEANEDGDVVLTVADDDETLYFTMEPYMAANLAAKIFDVLEENKT
jgi:hypothetical protein